MQKIGPIGEALSALGADPRFAPLIKKHGAPDINRGKNVFRALVRSIVYQQLSGKAAGTIFARFQALFPGRAFPKPTQVLKMPLSKLRKAGLSRQKAAYIKDVARKFAKGTIPHRKFSKMSSEEIMTHLIQIKGVGEWTVHMLLIFTLGHLDVLPTGDLGVRKGLQIVYGLKTLPTPKQMERLAKPWRQYASVASWYLWQAAETRPPAEIRVKK